MVMKRASLIASSTCSRLYFLDFLASGRAQLTPGGVVDVHTMNFLPAIIAVTVLGALPESEANFVPGEVMVKFVSGSDAEKAVREMSQKFPLRLDDFVQVVRHLEASVRIPLTVSQVTSGNWLVLKIDSETMSRELAERLRGYQNVAEVELLGEDKKPVGYMPPKKIALKFVPGSQEANTISEKLANRDEADFGTLMSKLQQRAESPLKAEVMAQNGLLLQVDLASLTLTLQDRLRSLPSVESTQLNYVMTTF